MRALFPPEPNVPTRALSREEFLYPAVSPLRTGRLPLDALHTMYWEESGNPRGVPVVFLHGGPGGGSAPDHRRFFDPALLPHRRLRPARRRPLDAARRAHRQHHAAPGRRPRAAARAPRHRALAGVRRLVGHRRSRSPTREAHPERCSALVLRGIFLCRAERDRLVPLRPAHVFPEAWRAFARFLPEAERGDLLAAYYRRLIDPDPAVHMPAARAWSVYEGSCSTLLPDPELVAALRRGRRGAGPRAHRGALLRQRHLPARERAARRASSACGTFPA